MDEMLTIILLTYAANPDRMEYAHIALESTLRNLHYSGELWVHIADDGSAVEHRVALRDHAASFDKVKGVTITNSDRMGYGRNMTLAQEKIRPFSDVVLPLEDDWELINLLDADPLVEALRDDRVNCIRLGYLGSTQRLAGQIIHTPSQTLLLFDHDTEEPHVFAGHPRLETVEYEASVGPWPERIPDESPDYIAPPGPTEFMVCHRKAARIGVAWPLDAGLTAAPSRSTAFVHIGATRSTED